MSAPVRARCPEWCDPRFCDAGRHDHATRHASKPITWRVGRDDVEMTVTAEQNTEHGQPDHRSGVLLRVYNTASVWPDGSPIHATVFLGPDDISRLHAELTRAWAVTL